MYTKPTISQLKELTIFENINIFQRINTNFLISESLFIVREIEGLAVIYCFNSKGIVKSINRIFKSEKALLKFLFAFLGE